MSGRRFREERVLLYPKLTPEERKDLEARPRPHDEPSLAPRPHGEVRQVSTFDGSEGTITTYQGGGPGTQERVSGADSLKPILSQWEFISWMGLVPKGQEPSRYILPFPTREDDPEVLGTESIAGVECLKLRGRNSRSPWQVTWWVAPRYNYLTMRIDETKEIAGSAAGQYLLVRKRVTQVKSFPGGIHLPARVEKTVVRMTPVGATASVLLRWRFSASGLRVNVPVKETALAAPDPSSIGLEVKQAEQGGCAYHALVDFAQIMAAQLDTAAREDLAQLYDQKEHASLLDLATDLQTLTGRRLQGYRASLGEVQDLNRPVIAHFDLGEGNLHFIVLESVGEHFTRVFDGGRMHVVPTRDLLTGYKGVILAVGSDRLPLDSEVLPRVNCANAVLPSTPSARTGEREEYRFAVANAGEAPLKLERLRVYPEMEPLEAAFPELIAAGERAEVLVRRAGANPSHRAWALVLSTNDPLRPTLWLGADGAKQGPELVLERR